MFREMRRFGQQMPENEAIEILKNATSGTLAVLGDDGYPYAVPMSHFYCEGKIYFHCASEGHKIDAIRNCDKVSFCVISRDDVVPEKFTTYYCSVIAFGRVRILEDVQEKVTAIRCRTGSCRAISRAASSIFLGPWRATPCWISSTSAILKPWRPTSPFRACACWR